MQEKKYSYRIEGLDLEIEATTQKEIDENRSALLFRAIRYASGMNRKDFCNWLGIPYRTVQEWELGGRTMPDYVLKLIAYKIASEKKAGRI